MSRKIFATFTLCVCVWLSGCVTSPESVSLRRQLVDEARADMTSASEEVAEYFQLDLRREAEIARGKLEAQFAVAVRALEEQSPGVATPDILKALARYNEQRARVESELLVRAQNQSVILAKLGAGPVAIDALEQMLVVEASEQQRVLRGALAAVLGVAAEGSVDPALLDAVRNVFDPAETP